MEVLHLIREVKSNLRHGGRHGVGIGAEDSGRIDVVLVKLLDDVVGHSIERHDCVHLVAEELHAQDIVGVGEVDIHGVALDAEASTVEVVVVAHVVRVHEAVE